ncbi:helix-turn-helix domain-containing protein [Thermoleophilia bacterium SCSIO 60948]|nr:helix-turn-helix domain-containing protein [Thermoleophilia bacterium SCSIO 60948]
MSGGREQGEATTKLMRVLSHPLRQRILNELNEREASPSELSQALGEPLGNVAYHVKILERNEAVELVGTRPVRGALEHFYKAVVKARIDEGTWSELPRSVRGTLVGDSLSGLWSDLVAAAGESGLDSSTARVERVGLELDREGADRIAAKLADLLDEARAEQSAAAERLASGGEAERVELALLLFGRG